MEENTTHLQRIAYCHASEIGHFMLDVLRVMKREFGSQIHVYCNIREQVSFYKQALDDGEIDSVRVVSGLFEKLPPAPADLTRVVEQARENERLLKTTYNRLIMGSRTFGRGFSPGGFYHPIAKFAQDAGYEQILEAYNRTLAVWKEEFEQYRFTAVISPTLELGYLAESYGIPMRSYINAGQSNWYIWTTNRYDESAELDRTMEKMPECTPVDIGGTYGSNVAIMDSIKRDLQLHRCLFLAASDVLKGLYWRLRGYQKAQSYRVRDRSQFYFRRRRQMRTLSCLATARIADLTDRRFVFFPLHEEPETVLTIGAPERTNQLAAIAAVARDLPAGVWLAVKETYFGVGRRPSEFYRQIADFKNVIMLDVTESGLEVARLADAVVTIRGTVGQEAGILGRPVIVLAHHNAYSSIPHVRCSDLDKGLKDALAWALSEDFDHKRAQIDGGRFYESLRSVSVDMRDFSYFSQETYDMDLPAVAVEYLKRSFGVHDEAGRLRQLAVE